MDKYKIGSSVFITIAAILLGLAMEYLIRLGEGLVNGVPQIELFNSGTYRLMIIFACSGAFLIFLWWVTNRESSKKADEQYKTIIKSLSDIKNSIDTLVQEIRQERNERNNPTNQRSNPKSKL